MASLGIRKFQDLIGRTDLLKVRENIDLEKPKTLNLSSILRNALDMRPGVNIRGGSVKQDFQLELRSDNLLLEKALPVINGEQKSVDIEITINNESRAFASTLSYHISKLVFLLFINIFKCLSIKMLKLETCNLEPFRINLFNILTILGNMEKRDFLRTVLI